MEQYEAVQTVLNYIVWETAERWAADENNALTCPDTLIERPETIRSCSNKITKSHVQDNIIYVMITNGLQLKMTVSDFAFKVRNAIINAVQTPPRTTFAEQAAAKIFLQLPHQVPHTCYETAKAFLDAIHQSGQLERFLNKACRASTFLVEEAIEDALYVSREINEEEIPNFRYKYQRLPDGNALKTAISLRQIIEIITELIQQNTKDNS